MSHNVPFASRVTLFSSDFTGYCIITVTLWVDHSLSMLLGQTFFLTISQYSQVNKASVLMLLNLVAAGW